MKPSEVSFINHIQ